MSNVYVLLDRSGSMGVQWEQAIDAVNTYVSNLINVKAYVATFDNTSYDVLRNITDPVWKPIAYNESHPRGSTPLYDAFGKLLDVVISHNPEKAVIVVMTDGFENSSTEYNKEAVMARLKSAEDRKWPVVFLGAGFDQVDDSAKALGIVATRSAHITKGLLGTGAQLLSEKTMAYYASFDNEPNTAYSSMSFTDKEKADLAGKTTFTPEEMKKRMGLNQATDLPVATPTKRTRKKKNES